MIILFKIKTIRLITNDNIDIDNYRIDITYNNNDNNNDDDNNNYNDNGG